MTKEEAVDVFGEVITRLDNLVGAMQLPMPPKFHVEQLSKALPEVSAQLKEAYAVIVGENPWEE